MPSAGMASTSAAPRTQANDAAFSAATDERNERVKPETAEEGAGKDTVGDILSV